MLTAPIRFVWSWPEVDVTALEPAMVIIARESDGRWYVTFTVETAAPQPLPETGHAAGRAVARGSPGDACGAGVRHPGSSRVRPAVKQEPRPVTAEIPVLQGGE